LDSATRSKIEEVLATRGEGVFGNRPRFALVDKGQIRRQEKVKLGTYGMIKGVRYFLAGAATRADRAEADYGFLFEQVLLEMTRLGLGTCWLGGTFSRNQWGQVLRQDSREFIPSIAALGFAAPRRGRVDRLVRWGARADRRKPWKHLFFEGDFRRALSPAAAGPGARVLEMVRLAPSASNKQPWRVVQGEGSFHFYLARTPGYVANLLSADLQMVDMGIAMCHFQLAAGELGLDGGWQHSPPDIRSPRGEEYIHTWQM